MRLTCTLKGTKRDFKVGYISLHNLKDKVYPGRSCCGLLEESEADPFFTGHSELLSRFQWLFLKLPRHTPISQGA